MAKLFAVVNMQGGAPDTGALTAGRDYKGFVHCTTFGQFGLYLFAGTGAQLAALDALPTVIGLVAMTEAGGVRWGELDTNISAAKRTRLNTWLTARGFSTIAAGANYRQIVMGLARRNFPDFDLNQNDLEE